MPKSIQHPGLLVKNLLDDYNLSPATAAKDLSLSYSSLRLLLNGKLRVSAPVALRLSRYFGKPIQFWIDLQNKFELAEASGDAKLSAILKKIPKAKKAPAPKAPKTPAKAKNAAAVKRGRRARKV
jgi:addiction module HigA family antidote